MYFLFGFFFILILFCIAFCHWRKACIIKKVCSMTCSEKCHLLNELIHPFGYQYLLKQDLFFTTFDAWQRKFGYANIYNCTAPFFHMVFDSEPVYFDYNGRTWLIEFWKGQYGINTGAEIGIYCADSLVEPGQRNHTLFHTVSDSDIPVFSMNLKYNTKTTCQDVGSLSMPHWWLAIFKMGLFSNPNNLLVNFCIEFPSYDMMLAFRDALIEKGYDHCSLQTYGCRICFSFRSPKSPVPCGILTKPVRIIAQLGNRLLCSLYRFVTRAFDCTLDRLIYLYFYLPFLFGHCLHLRRCKKRTPKGVHL